MGSGFSLPEWFIFCSDKHYFRKVWCLKHCARDLSLSKIESTLRLVVVSLGEHLLLHGPQVDCVLKLSYVAALVVTQWRVWIHDAVVAQVFQSHQVLAFT